MPTYIIYFWYKFKREIVRERNGVRAQGLTDAKKKLAYIYLII